MGENIDNFIEEFNTSPDIVVKLRMFNQREDVQQFIKDNLAFESGKSHTEAIRLKDEGNKFFVKGKFSNSLKKYDSAIELADDQKTFSVLLGNRSAAFYNLKKYQMCLDDIEVAFENNCSETLELKLLERRAKCVYNLCDKDKFVGQIEKINNTNFNDPVLLEKKKKLLTELQELNESMKTNRSSIISNKQEQLTKLEKRNKYFDGFSDVVEMRSSETRGRYMVATENIPVGEVIGAEKPICSVLAAHKAGTQCSECLGMLPDDYFLPCLGCREARFCCPSCWRAGSAAGARSPHRLECGLRADLGPILKEVKGGDAVPEYHRLCLRLLGRMTVEEVVELERRVREGISGTERQREADINSLFNLVGLDHQRSLETDFWIYLVTCFYLRLLQTKQYFSGTINGERCTKLSNEEASTGAFLVRVMQILQFNVHCVMQAVIKRGESFSMESIGNAIYSSFAFLNHSCNPNTVKYWEGDRMVVVASQVIRKGQEVTDNYGMHFLNTGRAVRRQWLQDTFWFQCGCPACEAEWPVRDQVSDKPGNVICSGAGCDNLMRASGDTWTCPGCGRSRDNAQLKSFLSAQVMKTVNTAQCDLDEESARRVYKDILDDLYTTVSHPWRGLIMPEQLFWKAVRMTNGNKAFI